MCELGRVVTLADRLMGPHGSPQGRSSSHPSQVYGVGGDAPGWGHCRDQEQDQRSSVTGMSREGSADSFQEA